MEVFYVASLCPRWGDEVLFLQVLLQPGQQPRLQGTRGQGSLLFLWRLQRDRQWLQAGWRGQLPDTAATLAATPSLQLTLPPSSHPYPCPQNHANDSYIRSKSWICHFPPSVRQHDVLKITFECCPLLTVKLCRPLKFHLTLKLTLYSSNLFEYVDCWVQCTHIAHVYTHTVYAHTNYCNLKISFCHS